MINANAVKEPQICHDGAAAKFRTSRSVLINNAGYIAVLACSLTLYACGGESGSMEQSATRHMDDMSARVSQFATEAGIPVDQNGTVAVAHSDGGSAVFMPSPHEDGRMVGWLDLPESNPCSARVTPGYYVIEPYLNEDSASLTLRQIAGSVSLDNIRSDLERKLDDNADHPDLVRVTMGPETFSTWGWHKCSDGVGCCRWALTLDASNPACR